MNNYLGIDGFRFGWVAAWIGERGDHGFDYSPGLTRLLALPHVRAMIDMPIGLNPAGYRLCDLRARELIWPRRVSRCAPRSLDVHRHGRGQPLLLGA
ncbi:putative RNase H-like nuclease [Bradyrhizobium ottawaense]